MNNLSEPSPECPISILKYIAASLAALNNIDIENEHRAAIIINTK